MAELVDAQDLKSCSGNTMRVRFPLSAPERKSQRVLVRLASLGDQFILNFGRKNQLAISLGEKKIFSFYICY